jgi:hypothetical protein
MTLRILYSALFIKEYFKVWQLAFDLVYHNLMQILRMVFIFKSYYFHRDFPPFLFMAACLPDGLFCYFQVYSLLFLRMYFWTKIISGQHLWSISLLDWLASVCRHMWCIYSFHWFQLLWYFCWLQLFIITSFFVNILVFGLLVTAGKNLSSKKLFAFAITRTDEFCKLTVRWVLFFSSQLISKIHP